MKCPHCQKAIELELPKPSEAHEAFDKFWVMYPRKIAKGAARKAWRKIPAHLYDDVFSAVEVQKKSWLARPYDERHFIPHPSTWLNQERWEDEPEDLPGSQQSARFKVLN